MAGRHAGAIPKAHDALYFRVTPSDNRGAQNEKRRILVSILHTAELGGMGTICSPSPVIRGHEVRRPFLQCVRAHAQRS
jgi:hypothetical protein